MKILSYMIEGEQIKIKIQRTKNKNMYLKIKNNNILVTAPFYFSQNEILKFVNENVAKFASYLKNKKSKEFFDPNQGEVYIKGKKFKIVRMTGFSYPKVELSLNNILIKTNDGNDAIVKKTIKDYLKTSTKEYIIKRQRDYEVLMNIPMHKVKVSHKESTWGTNYIDKKEIIYAAKLGHYSEKVINYVIVHELTHYKHPNHSQTFWNEIKLYMPNYKEIKKILKVNTSMEKENK